VSQSILFPGPERPDDLPAQPTEDSLRDLGLDQIIAAVTAGWQEFDLAPFLACALADAGAIRWRQAIMRDIERVGVRSAVKAFAGRMREMRVRLDRAAKSYYPLERARWFLSAAEAYCEGVLQLDRDLRSETPRSAGLQAWHEWLAAYIHSRAFARLAADTRSVADGLAAIVVNLHIDGNRIVVLPYAGEGDYTADVEATFARFRQGPVTDYRARVPHSTGLNHVEAQIVDRIALLHPEVFRALEAFGADHADFVDPAIARFDREVHFYVAYLAFVEALRSDALPFCYPVISDTDKTTSVRDAFDLALARRLHATGTPVVTNSFTWSGDERIFVITGPNHGGKTTFARMVGQVHHLARLGVPVPGTAARLFLCDRIFTHFEREEDAATLRGKLQDDLLRIRRILDAATPRSLVVLNEIFSSTTVHDAIVLSGRILSRISELDALAVCVTFLGELSTFDRKTVSLAASADPDDPSRRTFTIEPRPAEGVAYALALARKYRVTEAHLRERIRT